jgi:hypothetical protein
MVSDLQTDDLAGLNPETGRPPKQRVSTVQAARSIEASLCSADDKRASNRALIDAMFNGAPPFKQADLIESGQGERTNLDFGEAAALKEQALAGYYDLTSSVDVLARVTLNYGTSEQRAEWEQVVSEEFHRTLREWPELEFNHQMLCDQFVSHGVGFTYFEDEHDWRWRVAGLRDFRVPNNTKANEQAIEVATAEREFQAHQLYHFIRDPKVARDMGWNVDMVRAALLNSCNSDSTASPGSWEQLEVELKNNDLVFSGSAKSKKIDVVHMWVQEFSGKVTHFIFLKTPLYVGEEANREDFLYSKVDRFDRPTSCFVAFCYGVGNGTLHSIRGLGFKIYPHIQLLNRLRCGMVDGALLSSSLIVQPGDQGSRALEDLTLTYYGPYALFPPGLKIVDKAIPDYSRNVMPVLNDITMNMQNRTLGFQSRAITPDGQERTAYEVRAQLQQDAVLTASSINLFYHPWKRLLTEVYRRLSASDYSALRSGGQQAVEFRKRCMARDVPEAALSKFTAVEPVRAIGFGSPGMRQAAIDETMAIFGSLDEAGRVNLLRDRIAARFGQEVVDRYLPKPGTSTRPPIDDKIALLENASMTAGTALPVSPGENHFIHASRHLTALDAMEEALTQGAADPQRVLVAYQIVLPHLGQHLEALAPDVTRKDEIALMRQRFQQLNAAAGRLADELQAAQEQQAKAAEAEQARAMQAEQARVNQMQQELAEAKMLSPKAMAELEERRAKLAMKSEEHRFNLEAKQAKAMQELALADAKTAADIRGSVPPIRGE